MADSFIVAEALVVAPASDNLVLTARDEVLALFGDREGIDLALLTAVQHTDRLSIEGRPVSDFFI